MTAAPVHTCTPAAADAVRQAGQAAGLLADHTSGALTPAALRRHMVKDHAAGILPASAHALVALHAAWHLDDVLAAQAALRLAEDNAAGVTHTCVQGPLCGAWADPSWPMDPHSTSQWPCPHESCIAVANDYCCQCDGDYHEDADAWAHRARVLGAVLAHQRCPAAACGLFVRYVGQWGAPGYGECWVCDGGGHSWTRQGQQWMDSADARELTPAMVL